jgi:CMP-N,N'-diacetyllegionaminic acid synthase
VQGLLLLCPVIHGKERAVKVLGIIPARGGSKGIPRKNIKALAGKPLLAWTAEAALKSKLDRVILSSEDAEIIEIAKSKGIDVPFIRPAALASDEAPAIDVVLHAVETLAKSENYRPDAVMLLQPTSPLRTSRHINEALELFERHPDATSLVSVMKVPHSMIPESLMTLNDEGYLRPVRAWDERRALRQEKPVYYARNGAAVYLVRSACLLSQRSLYGDRILGYEMPKEESMDIDDLFDFEICEYLLKTREEGEDRK